MFRRHPIQLLRILFYVVLMIATVWYATSRPLTQAVSLFGLLALWIYLGIPRCCQRKE